MHARADQQFEKMMSDAATRRSAMDEMKKARPIMLASALAMTLLPFIFMAAVHAPANTPPGAPGYLWFLAAMGWIGCTRMDLQYRMLQTFEHAQRRSDEATRG